MDSCVKECMYSVHACAYVYNNEGMNLTVFITFVAYRALFKSVTAAVDQE